MRTAGSFDLLFTTRAFDTPLFGDASTSYLRLFGHQFLAAGPELSAWASHGFPNLRTDGGIQVDRIQAAEVELRVNAGDFLIEPLETDAFLPLPRQVYPLQGLALRSRGEARSWSVFAGRAKFFRPLRLPDEELEEQETPRLFGGRYLARAGRQHIGFSVTGVTDALFVDGRHEDLASVASLDLVREITPWSYLFGDLLVTDRGGVGGRLGLARRFAAGQLSASVYSFDRDFPFVFPLYRPAERGIRVDGRYRAGDMWWLFGGATYFIETARQDRRDLRLNAGASWDLGTDRPFLTLSYSRNDIVFDSLSIATPDRLTDRVALSTSLSTRTRSIGLTLEHLFESGDFPDRSQARLRYRALVGDQSIVSLFVLGQLLDGRDVGVTAEVILERPLWRRYDYKIGLGGAFVERGGVERGDGVVRAGIARRVGREGWTIGLEVIETFDVGLPSSGLGRRQVVLSVGHRMRWRDAEDLRMKVAPLFFPEALGSVEGRVHAEGVGVPGIGILVEGEVRARTDAEGRFRIPRVPARTVTVALDMRTVDPRLHPVGEPFRTLELGPREVRDVEFELRELSYFQGSVVYCLDGEEIPLARATVRLEGEEVVFTATTSPLGDFLFDEIPPGIYELILEPEEIPALELEEPLVWTVDLTEDLTGFLLRISCPDDGTDRFGSRVSARR